MALDESVCVHEENVAGDVTRSMRIGCSVLNFDSKSLLFIKQVPVLTSNRGPVGSGSCWSIYTLTRVVWFDCK